MRDVEARLKVDWVVVVMKGGNSYVTSLSEAAVGKPLKPLTSMWLPGDILVPVILNLPPLNEICPLSWLVLLGKPTLRADPKEKYP